MSFTSSVLDELHHVDFSETSLVTGGRDMLPASTFSFTEVMQGFNEGDDPDHGDSETLADLMSGPDPDPTVASLVAKEDPIVEKEAVTTEDEPVSKLLSTLSFPAQPESKKKKQKEGDQKVSDLMAQIGAPPPRAEVQSVEGDPVDEERADAPGDIDLTSIAEHPFQDFGSHAFIDDGLSGDNLLDESEIQAVI